MRVQGQGSNSCSLEVYSNGPIGAPAVVLIADADTAAIRWSPALVQALLAGGLRVVTFDHRDTGASARATPGYLLDDMADDIVAIADALELPDVALLGLGMGGTVALHVALRHAPRVRSMVLVGASPGRSDDRLPEPSPDLVEAMVARAWAGPPETREDRIAAGLDLLGHLCGSRYGFDEQGEFGRIMAEVDQQLELEAVEGRRESGHGNAVIETPSVLDRLAAIDVPTLVLHGTDDPVYPQGHAEAVATNLPHGQLVLVPGLGHELPDALVADYGEQIVAALR